MQKNVLGRPPGKRRLKWHRRGLGVILKWILQEKDLKMGIGFSWLRIEQASPRTTTLSKHMLRVGRLPSSDDPYSYAGGSVSSWQGHPSQTCQRVGAILCVVNWSSMLGVGRRANNSTPYKVPCYETSKRRQSFFKNCRAREGEEE
jgi:hypothetical protein